MGSIASWNIRGLNRTPKQKKVRQVILDNHVQVCAILETHVDSSKVYNICAKVCHNWSWTSNANCCDKGTRIMVGWDVNEVDVMTLAQTDQVIHTQIVFKMDGKSVFCSFVYADNHYKVRRDLWQNLCVHHSFVHDKPWVIMGDFNASLFHEDVLQGASALSIGSREFKECVDRVGVFDVNSNGLHFTWSNKQKKGAIFKKLDRILGNIHLVDSFPMAAAFYLPYRLSDHSPCILKLPSITREKPKPFKFVNLVADKNDFLDEVKRVWCNDISGHKMFQVVKKLKNLKSPMRKLLFKLGNVHEKVKIARKELDDCQRAIDVNPDNDMFLDQHGVLLAKYKEAVYDEGVFLQQKAKVEWLNLGDSNSKYFRS
ncbi:putative endonuclease/exonuclease/phosphatase [Helianthus annuus]|nr:putative endonuclease/exonuclease/phosphatase [Helianthus annuus]